MAIHDLFAYLRAKDAEAAVAFYKTVFGATEKFRLVEPSGRIGHVELDFGSSTLMISDEFPEYGCFAPDPEAKAAMTLHVHVDDCDAVFAAALRAGARPVRAPEDQFYGERSGTFRDPFGYEWNVGHSIEELTPAEMQRRYTAMFSSAGS